MLSANHAFRRYGDYLISTTTRFDANMFAVDVKGGANADVITGMLATPLGHLDVRDDLIFATRTVGGYLTDEVAALRFENGVFKELSSIPLRGVRNGIAVNDDVAYVMTAQARDSESGVLLPAGVAIVDIGDPEAMTQRGAIELSKNVLEGFIAEARLFAIGQEGAYVFDLSDPFLPIEVAYLDSWTGKMAIVENTAYVVRQGSLKIFDISQIEEPAEQATLARFRTPIWDVAVVDDKVYTLESDALQVFDLTDVGAPRRERVYLWDDGAPFGTLAVVGEYAVISGSGLRIVDLSRCEAVASKP